MIAPSPVAGSGDAPGVDAVPGGESSFSGSSYPGGKSGAGVYQRLINLIPRHRILIVPFAGKCGVTRRIRTAEHSIVIDRDERVCQWWCDWSRRPEGRSIEIHHACGIDWLTYRSGVSSYPAAAETKVAAVPLDSASPPAFVFADPPYVMSGRSTGRIYRHEMSDDDHLRLLQLVTRMNATEYSVMLCGYPLPFYEPLDLLCVKRIWRRLLHKVPTRGGLQIEAVWMNYRSVEKLHDTRQLGRDRRERERIRRRQKTVLSMLAEMGSHERDAMLEAIGATSVQ